MGLHCSNDYRLLADFLISNQTSEDTCDIYDPLPNMRSFLYHAEILASDPKEYLGLAYSHFLLHDQNKADYFENIAFNLLREKNTPTYTYELLANLMDEFELLNNKGPFPEHWGNLMGEIILEQEQKAS